MARACADTRTHKTARATSKGNAGGEEEAGEAGALGLVAGLAYRGGDVAQGGFERVRRWRLASRAPCLPDGAQGERDVECRQCGGEQGG